MRIAWLLICAALLGACAAEPPPATPTPARPTPRAAASAPPGQEATATPEPGPPAVADFRQGRVSGFRSPADDLQGLYAQPDAPGRYPLILVIHGDHSPCPADLPDYSAKLCPDGQGRPYVEGMAYLLDALAAQGYIAIAPDIAPALTAAMPQALGGEAYGSPDVLQSTLFTLVKLLREADKGDRTVWEDMVDQVDFKRIGMISHSAGASLASEGLSGAQIGGGDLAGHLLVAPLPLDLSVVRITPPTTPFAVIEAACDGLAPRAGRALIVGGESAILRSLVLLPGANHNQFNQLAERESAQAERASPECRSGQRLAPEDQRRFLAQYALAFFDHLFARGERAPAGLDFTQPPVETLFGLPAQVWTQLPAARRQALLGGPAGDGNGQGMAAQGLDTGRCDSSSCPLYMAGYGGAMRFGWTRPDLRFELPLYGADTDLSAFKLLHLRLLVDPDDVRNRPFERQALGVLLRDLAGHEALVSVPPDSLALRRPQPGPPQAGESPELLPVSLVLPLADFAGVDLGQVVSLELVFPNQSGLLYLAEIEALRE